jgi:hypothetical protein
MLAPVQPELLGKRVKTERVIVAPCVDQDAWGLVERQFQEFLCTAQKSLDPPLVVAYMPVRAALQQNVPQVLPPQEAAV